VFRRSLIVTAMLVISLLITSQPAWATFAGRNGWIVYSGESDDLKLVMSNGTHEHEITAFGDSKSVEAPQFSADGRWIVFGINLGGKTDLYVIRTDGSHLHRVTNTPKRYEWGPSWSPDGRSIVFSKDGGPSPIVAMNRDGTHRHRIGHAVGEFPRYSPDGNGIAYGGSDGEIHVMGADGAHDVALTSRGNNNYPDWSPNGQSIAFIRGGGGWQREVWIMRADGSHERQVTVTHSAIGVFSPNGKRIAFSASTSSKIRVSHVDGTHRHAVGDVIEFGFGISWQARS
jgi:Tol biopolymer transport system component